MNCGLSQLIYFPLVRCFITKESTTEQKIKAEASDALIKHVFDNLSNVLICTTIAIAGAAVIRNRDLLALGPEVNTILGIAILFSALALLGWNMIHGIERIIRPIKGSRKSLLFALLAAVYMFAVLAVFHAWSLTQVQQISRIAPYTTVEMDAPQAAVSPRPSP